MKHWILILLLGLTAACSGNLDAPEEPDDLIDRETMVKVFRELVVMEAYAQIRYEVPHNYHKVMKESGYQCLEKFHISSERFERSYSYYASRQEELQSIYQEVMDSLTREVNALMIKQPKQQLPNDTVRVMR